MLILVCLFAFASEPTSNATSQPRTLHAPSEERIDFIQQRLDKGTVSAKAWWYGWIIGFGTLTAVQAGGLLFIEAGILPTSMRPMLIVGGSATLIGTLLTMITGMPAAHAAEQLRKHRALPESGSDESLRVAEHLLEKAAIAEAFERGVWNHLLNGAAALAQGLILGLAFQQTVPAILQGNVSMLITEAKQWSQPIHAIIDWKEYKQRFGGGEPTSAQTAGAHFIVVPGGLGLAGAF